MTSSGTSQHEEIYSFNRPKKFQKIRELGQGACGTTLLVRDADLDLEFVIKKYMPSSDITKTIERDLDLFERFKKEAQVLFKINHPYIVRVYNYFDYSEHHAAYIIMEHIDGENILDYCLGNPQKIQSVFEKVILGFQHLEAHGILHRDIRKDNILVTNTGTPKLIDFGFAKSGEIDGSTESKSISLNWITHPPEDFSQQTYDHRTEIYFVGSLFREILNKAKIKNFSHSTTIDAMIDKSRSTRFSSFNDIISEMRNKNSITAIFSQKEINTFRYFSNALVSSVSHVEPSAKINTEAKETLEYLCVLYKKVMLHSAIPNVNDLLRCFIIGNFSYYNNEVPVDILKDFIELMQLSDDEKRALIMDNVNSAFQTIERRSEDDEIPF